MPLVSPPTISIVDLINEFLEDEKSHLADNTSSYDAFESRLKRSSETQVLNGIDALHLAGIYYVNEVTRQRLRRTANHLKSSPNKMDASNVATAIRQALIWGIENRSYYGFQCNTSDVRTWLKMPSKKAEKIIQISEEELIALKNSSLGDTPIEHLQNRIMIITLALGHGIRTGSEIVSLKEKDLNPNLMELTVHRKGETDQVIPLRKQDTTDLNSWIKSKNKYIQKYSKNYKNIKNINTDALFIRINPNQRNGEINWALPPSGPNIAFKKLREALNIDENKIFGTLRHTSCTMQQQNAMSMGYHEKYAATLNAHSEQTERDYYVSILGPEVEILSRFPDENIDFCESIFTDSLLKYKNTPSEIRHLACAMTSLEIMGRLQFRSVLQSYRNNKNDLEKLSPNDKNLKVFIDRVTKLFR